MFIQAAQHMAHRSAVKVSLYVAVSKQSSDFTVFVDTICKLITKVYVLFGVTFWSKLNSDKENWHLFVCGKTQANTVLNLIDTWLINVSMSKVRK